jgi:hypothetical protein
MKAIMEELTNILSKFKHKKITIKEWLNRSENDFHTKELKYCHIQKQRNYGLNTLSINQILTHYLNNIETWDFSLLDAYGSCNFKTNRGQFSLLNSYGDEDFSQERVHPNSILYTPCLFHNERIAVGDIVVEHKTGKIKLTNFMTSRLPFELLFLPNTYFIGKRAFYFHKIGIISLRFPIGETYNKLPKELKHFEAEEWLSGPRVLIRVYPEGR